ncbi:hypothetical protein N1851_008283 [Merluccius polli]|uniref:Uncharacterized protein n=1 Tax=Merluccius polli TaxID=89951 RepID=A0AA47N1Q5_MERPO|nr:hypothetical protein N1851_008283 [Merluccius polli]
MEQVVGSEKAGPLRALVLEGEDGRGLECQEEEGALKKNAITQGMNPKDAKRALSNSSTGGAVALLLHQGMGKRTGCIPLRLQSMFSLLFCVMESGYGNGPHGTTVFRGCKDSELMSAPWFVGKPNTPVLISGNDATLSPPRRDAVPLALTLTRVGKRVMALWIMGLLGLMATTHPAIHLGLLFMRKLQWWFARQRVGSQATQIQNSHRTRNNGEILLRSSKEFPWGNPRPLALAHQNLLSPRALHIAGAQNFGADLMSHGSPCRDEWRLHPDIVRLIWQRFGMVQVKVYVAAVTAGHVGCDGKPVFSHPLVERFLRGARHVKPVVRGLVPRWDLPIVFSCVIGAPF